MAVLTGEAYDGPHRGEGGEPSIKRNGGSTAGESRRSRRHLAASRPRGTPRSYAMLPGGVRRREEEKGRGKGGGRRKRAGGCGQLSQNLPCSTMTSMESHLAVPASRRAYTCLHHWSNTSSTSVRACVNLPLQPTKAFSAPPPHGRAHQVRETEGDDGLRVRWRG